MEPNISLLICNAEFVALRDRTINNRPQWRGDGNYWKIGCRGFGNNGKMFRIIPGANRFYDNFFSIAPAPLPGFADVRKIRSPGNIYFFSSLIVGGPLPLLNSRTIDPTDDVE